MRMMFDRLQSHPFLIWKIIACICGLALLTSIIRPTLRHPAALNRQSALVGEPSSTARLDSIRRRPPRWRQLLRNPQNSRSRKQSRLGYSRPAKATSQDKAESQGFATVQGPYALLQRRGQDDEKNDQAAHAAVSNVPDSGHGQHDQVSHPSLPESRENSSPPKGSGVQQLLDASPSLQPHGFQNELPAQWSRELRGFSEQPVSSPQLLNLIRFSQQQPDRERSELPHHLNANDPNHVLSQHLVAEEHGQSSSKPNEGRAEDTRDPTNSQQVVDPASDHASHHVSPKVDDPPKDPERRARPGRPRGQRKAPPKQTPTKSKGRRTKMLSLQSLPSSHREEGQDPQQVEADGEHEARQAHVEQKEREADRAAAFDQTSGRELRDEQRQEPFHRHMNQDLAIHHFSQRLIELRKLAQEQLQPKIIRDASSKPQSNEKSALSRQVIPSSDSGVLGVSFHHDGQQERILTPQRYVHGRRELRHLQELQEETEIGEQHKHGVQLRQSKQPHQLDISPQLLHQDKSKLMAHPSKEGTWPKAAIPGLLNIGGVRKSHDRSQLQPEATQVGFLLPSKMRQGLERSQMPGLPNFGGDDPRSRAHGNMHPLERLTQEGLEQHQTQLPARHLRQEHESRFLPQQRTYDDAGLVNHGLDMPSDKQPKFEPFRSDSNLRSYTLPPDQRYKSRSFNLDGRDPNPDSNPFMLDTQGKSLAQKRPAIQSQTANGNGYGHMSDQALHTPKRPAIAHPEDTSKADEDEMLSFFGAHAHGHFGALTRSDHPADSLLHEGPSKNPIYPPPNGLHRGPSGMQQQSGDPTPHLLMEPSGAFQHGSQGVGSYLPHSRRISLQQPRRAVQASHLLRVYVGDQERIEQARAQSQQAPSGYLGSALGVSGEQVEKNPATGEPGTLRVLHGNHQKQEQQPAAGTLSPTQQALREHLGLGHDSPTFLPRQALDGDAHAQQPPIANSDIQPVQRDFQSLQPSSKRSLLQYSLSRDMNIPQQALHGVAHAQQPLRADPDIQPVQRDSQIQQPFSKRPLLHYSLGRDMNIPQPLNENVRAPQPLRADPDVQPPQGGSISWQPRDRDSPVQHSLNADSKIQPLQNEDVRAQQPIKRELSFQTLLDSFGQYPSNEVKRSGTLFPGDRSTVHSGRSQLLFRTASNQQFFLAPTLPRAKGPPLPKELAVGASSDSRGTAGGSQSRILQPDQPHLTSSSSGEQRNVRAVGANEGHGNGSGNGNGNGSGLPSGDNNGNDNGDGNRPVSQAPDPQPQPYRGSVANSWGPLKGANHEAQLQYIRTRLQDDGWKRKQ